MKRARDLVAAGVALAVGIACAIAGRRQAATGRPPGPEDHFDCPRRVLLLGDSLGVGLEGPLRKEATADACKAELRAAVKGGSGAPYWAPKVVSELAAHEPDVVLISLGGNDYLRAGATAAEREKVKGAIEQIVDRARGRGALVLWIHPPPIPWPDKGDVVGMWRAELVPEYPTLEQKDIPYSSDGIHPTAEGYRMLAARIWPWVKQNVVANGPAGP